MRQLLLVAVLVTLLHFGDARPSSRPRVHASRGPSGRIVGGNFALWDQFPSQLSLEYLGSSGWSHICGAVLYRSRYALTAAHCVDATSVSNLRLWAGVMDRNDPSFTGGRILAVESYIKHENYSAILEGIPNNIAIISLFFPTDTSQANIGNAILPPDDTNDFNHGGCFVSGYGRTGDGNTMSQFLQFLQMPVITNNDCQERIVNVNHIALYPEHMCVLSDPPGNGPCNGDAGGPLHCYWTETDTAGTLYVVGLTSWNIANAGTCNLQFPTIVTRITAYLDWIELHTTV